jgi:hypothetical protein
MPLTQIVASNSIEAPKENTNCKPPVTKPPIYIKRKFGSFINVGNYSSKPTLNTQTNPNIERVAA